MKQIIYNTILLFLFAMLLAYIGVAFCWSGAEADQLAGHLSSAFRIDRHTLESAIENVLHAYWGRRAMLFGFPWDANFYLSIFKTRVSQS